MYNSSLPTDFGLVYQPKLHHEAIIGVEALLRPTDEKITTLGYISSIEDKFKLDISVIDKVIKDVKCYDLTVPVSINVHPSSLCNAEFISKVLECKDLIIELIEYEDLLFCDCFYENVDMLRKSGVMISLDDFGVDFATMDNALLLRPDQIKFDISLIRDIEKSYVKYRYLCFLYSKVVSLCTSGVIFEGVENIEQKRLIELFCEKPIFQGFYYYKPMTMSELVKLNLFDGPRVETLIDDNHHYDKFEYDVYSFVTKNSENPYYQEELNNLIQIRDPLGLVYNSDVNISKNNFRKIYYPTRNTTYSGMFSLVENAENVIVVRNEDGVVVFDNLEHQRLTGGSIVGASVESVIKRNENYQTCIEKDQHLLTLNDINFSRDIELFDGIEYETVREKLIYNDRNFVITTIRPLNLRTTSLSKDDLTGCFTRSYFKSNLVSFSNKTIAFIDLDGFKKVNDRLGHRKGDECLINFVSLMTSCLRGDDRLIRYGGDEFVVVFDSVLLDSITARLNEINHKIIDYFSRQNIELAFSYGLSHIENNNIAEAIEAADLSMYIAKNNKKFN